MPLQDEVAPSPCRRAVPGAEAQAKAPGPERHLGINLLQLSGVVKSVLGEKQVDAHVEGLFYVKGSSPVPFLSDARVDLSKR